LKVIQDPRLALLLAGLCFLYGLISSIWWTPSPNRMEVEIESLKHGDTMQVYYRYDRSGMRSYNEHLSARKFVHSPLEPSQVSFRLPGGSDLLGLRFDPAMKDNEMVIHTIRFNLRNLWGTHTLEEIKGYELPAVWKPNEMVVETQEQGEKLWIKTSASDPYFTFTDEFIASGPDLNTGTVWSLRGQRIASFFLGALALFFLCRLFQHLHPGIKTCIAWLLLATAIVYAGLYLNEHQVYWDNPEWMNDDTRQHLLPFMARQNPEAFQDGFLLTFTQSYLPHGYRMVMNGFSRTTHPLQASKQLGITLLLSSMLIAAGLGWRLGGPAGAGMCLILMIRSAAFDAHVFAGLFRSFAVPLGLIHIWLLLDRRHRLAAISLVVQALFYPPLALVFLPVNGLLLLADTRWRPWLHWRTFLPPVCGFAFCLLYLVFFTGRPPEIGSPIAYRDAVVMREFEHRGRLRELPLKDARTVWTNAMDIAMLTHYHGGRQVMPSHLNLTERFQIPVFTALVASILLLLIWTRNRMAWIWLITAISGTLLLYTANLFAFRVGFPDRFLAYGIPIATVPLWAALWGATRSRRALRVTAGILGIALLALYPWSLSRVEQKAFKADHAHEIYAALRDTDPDTLVASWAGREIPDEIPFQSGREVLVNFQNAHPMYFTYYNEVHNRILDCIRIAYSLDAGEITRIRDERGLTHFVVLRSLYQPEERSPIFYAPLEDLSAQVRRHRDVQEMVLASPDPEWIVAENDRYQLIDLTRIDASPAEISPPPELPEPILRYPGGLEWVSIEFDTLPLRPGENLTLKMNWQGPAHMAFVRWIIFVQFRDEDRILFTVDHSIFSDIDFAAQDWNLDHPMPFRYQQTIPLPADLPPGEISVHIGAKNPIDLDWITPLSADVHNGWFDTGIRLQVKP